MYRGHEKPAPSFRQEQAGAPENVDMKMSISGLSYTRLCLPALISLLRFILSPGDRLFQLDLVELHLNDPDAARKIEPLTLA